MKKEWFESLNSHQKDILERLCSDAVPADFRYSDLRTLLTGLGFLESNKGKTSGSRVKFFHRESKEIIMVHRPHPGDEMKKASVKGVRERLRDFRANAT